MAKNTAENYLDNLLNSVNYDLKDDTEAGDDLSTEFGSLGEQSDDDFLRQFESELESEEYSSFISGFDDDFEVDTLSEEKKEGASFIEDSDNDISLEEVLASVNASEIQEEKEEDSEQELTLEQQEEPLTSIDDLSLAVEDFETEEEDSKESALEELEEPDLAGKQDMDLMDMLGEEGLSDLGDLLSEENEEEALKSIDNYAENEMKASSEKAEAASDGSSSKNKKAKKDKKDKKGGLFAKIAALLFGEDEEEKVTLEVTEGVDVSSLSSENQMILKELEGGDDTEAGGKKKGKKKKKEPKPKKEKKPKEKDNTPPLPKKPVLLIIVMVASMCVLVMLGTNLTSYNKSISDAKSLYNVKSYSLAYQQLNGMKLKGDEDESMYQKLRLLSSVSSEMDAFDTFRKAGKEDIALDSIICAAGRYMVNYESAVEVGCLAEMEELRAQIEERLKLAYGMSFDQAVELYDSKDRNEYTVKLHKKLVELGLE
ncbi:MAG: hypothetical protein U0K68_05950 [Agathobacter sp.]|nr:hypothetical protein [Agathobacter sp.]